MENICKQIEEHLYSLHCLVNDVKDIGHAILCSHRGIPTAKLNYAFRVNVTEPDADNLIADVVRYYQSIGVKPCFVVFPSTRPQNFVDYLQRAGFKPVLEESDMVYRDEGKSFEAGADVNVVVDDGSMLDVWTDVFIKGFGIPIVLHDAFLNMFGKAIQYKGTKSYLGYFQGKPAGVCGLVSFNHVEAFSQ